ncbi:MAG: adenylate/guanylate cyclase domain-containing protein [Alphaproteobacteria bacterium]|nr:adenylate/guanylate cyclase domain-containing protein [Alphaproteobacteria bacterium]
MSEHGLVRTVGDEVAASVEATLTAEARRNEDAIATVRLVAMIGLSLTDIWYAMEGGIGVPWTYRTPTWAYTVVALVILVALRRGVFHPTMRVLLPLLDAGFVFVRSQLSFGFHSLDVLERGMELATVALGASLVIVSGGYRLSRASLITTTAASITLYLWFALQTELEVGQYAVHLVILAGIAAVTAGLTGQVKRAVRGEVARVTLSRFLPEALLEGVHADPVALVSRPRALRATVVITDIRGFTTWAERRDPIEVLDALNVVQGALAAAVRQHHGVVDKFMGDGMLAVFGLAEDRPHARDAVEAARTMREAMAALGGVAGRFRVGIGVHTGPLVAGCLGSGSRMEFTVLGDTVNTASRLEGATKELAPVLISEDTVTELGPDHGLTPVGEVQLRGRDEALRVWTLDA